MHECSGILNKRGYFGKDYPTLIKLNKIFSLFKPNSSDARPYIVVNPRFFSNIGRPYVMVWKGKVEYSKRQYASKVNRLVK